MKKLIGIALTLVSLGSLGTLTQANAAELSRSNVVAEAGAAPQWQRDRYPRVYNRRRVRTVRQTRIVRFGRRLYRETYLVTYFGNGRTDSRLVNRVRIG